MEAREKTNKLLEMIEHGLLKADYVVHCCLSYMSVELENEIYYLKYEEEEEDDD